MRLAFITNNARGRRARWRSTCGSWGGGDDDDVVTSSQAAARLLAERFGAGARVVVALGPTGCGRR